MRRASLLTLAAIAWIAATWMPAFAQTSWEDVPIGQCVEYGTDNYYGWSRLKAHLGPVMGEPVDPCLLRAYEHGMVTRTTTGVFWVQRGGVGSLIASFTRGSERWTSRPLGILYDDNSPLSAAELEILASLPPVAPPSGVFTDPFAYCASVGTIDAPDDRWAGPAVPNQVQSRLPGVAGDPVSTFRWRCLNGKVLWCWIRGNVSCEKADTSRQPTVEMVEYCRERPNSDLIPRASLPSTTVYEWRCQGTAPVVAGQRLTVDPRGFVAELWEELSDSGG